MKIKTCTSAHYIYCHKLEFVRRSGTWACCSEELPTTSPSHHFSPDTSGPQDLCLLTPPPPLLPLTLFLKWTTWTGNLLRSYDPCVIAKSKAIIYLTVCKRLNAAGLLYKMTSRVLCAI